MVSLPDTGTVYWHTPLIGFLTLTHVERIVICTFIAYVAVGFWFRDCNAHRGRVTDCLLAATEIVTLGLTSFAMPQHGG